MVVILCSPRSDSCAAVKSGRAISMLAKIGIGWLAHLRMPCSLYVESKYSCSVLMDSGDIIRTFLVRSTRRLFTL
jgi:hypothetical protein